MFYNQKFIIEKQMFIMSIQQYIHKYCDAAVQCRTVFLELKVVHDSALWTEKKKFKVCYVHNSICTIGIEVFAIENALCQCTHSLLHWR